MEVGSGGDRPTSNLFQTHDNDSNGLGHVVQKRNSKQWRAKWSKLITHFRIIEGIISAEARQRDVITRGLRVELRRDNKGQSCPI